MTKLLNVAEVGRQLIVVADDPIVNASRQVALKELQSKNSVDLARIGELAHVEQKNWTHVRQLLGYQRLEQPELVPLINQLYGTWGLLHNFFCPNLKLRSKTRKGGKTIRKYYPPQTPYQRLLDSQCLSPEQKQKLRNRSQELNPLQLKKQIEQQLKTVFDKARVR